MSVTAAILAAYAGDAAALFPRYEAISCEALYAPVADLLPKAPARVLDVGAGTGRDAAWLAEQGHRVLAVEPVEAFRRAGADVHRSPRIEWLDDALPDLARVLARGEAFDLVLLSGVWQHLDAEQRRRALPALAKLVAPGGLLILSLRHGPGAPNRPCFGGSPAETIAAAAGSGLGLEAERAAGSIQPGNRAAGVTWTWLAFSPRGDG